MKADIQLTPVFFLNFCFIFLIVSSLPFALATAENSSSNCSAIPTCQCNCAPVIYTGSNSCTPSRDDDTTSTTTTASSPTPFTDPPPFTNPPLFNNSNCQRVFSTNSGWFSSPFFPSQYPNNVNCSWLINATRQMVVSFTTFELETNFDFVKVYNGPTAAFPLLLSATSNIVPQPVLSTSNQVLVTFTTDGSVTSQGFFAAFYPRT